MPGPGRIARAPFSHASPVYRPWNIVTSSADLREDTTATAVLSGQVVETRSHPAPEASRRSQPLHLTPLRDRQDRATGWDRPAGSSAGECWIQVTGSTVSILLDIRGHENDTPAPGIDRHRPQDVPGRSGISTGRILRFSLPRTTDRGGLDGRYRAGRGELLLGLQAFRAGVPGHQRRSDVGVHPAISFALSRKPQQEIDFYWDTLSGGGRDGRCGWIDDRFGVSWQMVPANTGELMGRDSKRDGNPPRHARRARSVPRAVSESNTVLRHSLPSSAPSGRPGVPTRSPARNARGVRHERPAPATIGAEDPEAGGIRTGSRSRRGTGWLHRPGSKVERSPRAADFHREARPRSAQIRCWSRRIPGAPDRPPRGWPPRFGHPIGLETVRSCPGGQEPRAMGGRQAASSTSPSRDRPGDFGVVRLRGKLRALAGSSHGLYHPPVTDPVRQPVPGFVEAPRTRGRLTGREPRRAVSRQRPRGPSWKSTCSAPGAGAARHRRRRSQARPGRPGAAAYSESPWR